MGLVEKWDTTKIQRYAPSTSLQRLFREERYTTLIKEQLVLSVKSGLNNSMIKCIRELYFVCSVGK